MKKLIFFLSVFVFSSIVFTSCMVDEEDLAFDDQLLVGRWQSGTLYYKYFADGNGATWDTADDVLESEAQPFTWTLEKSELTHIHIMQIGGNVPKSYIVSELTATTLKYKDEFGKSFTFTKISN